MELYGRDTLWKRYNDSHEALLEAISSGTKEDVEKILRSEMYSFSRDSFYLRSLNYALKTACLQKKKSFVEILLRSGARVETCIFEVFDNITQETKAMDSEDIKILSLLLGNNDPNMRQIYFSLLRKAVEVESYDLVKFLCQHGADFSDVLSLAVSKGRCDLLDLLLSFKTGVKIEPSARDALYQALELGYSDCITILIKHCENNDITKIFEAAVKGDKLEILKLFPQLYMTVFQSNELVNKVFYRLVSLGNVDFLKFLLESGNNVMGLIEKNDQLLIEAPNVEVLQFLIAQGVAVHDNAKMCNHVLSLIRQNKSDMVKIFFDFGINIHSRNLKAELQGTILMEARSAEMVQLLIDKGENVNERVSVKYRGRKRAVSTTALLEALADKDQEGLKVLLENGADPEVRNFQGHSALMVASRVPSASGKVELLLKAGVCVNRQNKPGKTALSLAAGSDYTTDTVKLLLKYGADVNLQTSSKTALLNALRKQNFDMIEMLAESGLSSRIVNKTDEKGEAPLILAVKSLEDVQASKLISLFTVAGADVNKTDSQGFTALMKAAEYRRTLTVKALLEAGSNVNNTCRISDEICSAISLVLNKRKPYDRSKTG